MYPIALEIQWLYLEISGLAIKLGSWHAQSFTTQLLGHLLLLDNIVPPIRLFFHYLANSVLLCMCRPKSPLLTLYSFGIHTLNIVVTQ